MKSTQKQTPKKFASILDSDDEFPDSYEEPSEIPAYLNDSRFDHIELPWLNKCKPVEIEKVQQIKKSEDKAPEATKTKVIEKPILNKTEKSRILISSGVLTTQDLFLIKSIEEFCSESTLIWFIESLRNKSAPDRFHISCLTTNLFYDNSYNHNEQDLFDNFSANYYFNLIVS